MFKIASFGVSCQALGSLAPATDTADDPCTTSTTEAYKQAGILKLKTEADPDGGGSQTGRTTETICGCDVRVKGIRDGGTLSVVTSWIHM